MRTGYPPTQTHSGDPHDGHTLLTLYLYYRNLIDETEGRVVLLDGIGVKVSDCKQQTTQGKPTTGNTAMEYRKND